MPLIFSYGTLREPDVQRATLGRIVEGAADELVGFALSSIEVTDPAFVALTGKAIHANVAFTGRSQSRVRGVALEVDDAELLRCDEYEAPARYRRGMPRLASGRDAWVYSYAE